MDYNIYKHVMLGNGNILLEKLDNSILSNFNLKSLENGNILCEKKIRKKIENISEIIKYDFSKSNITYCLINNNDECKLKYRNILTHIYNIIGNGTKIIRNTVLNIQTTKRTSKGYYYINKLGISIQGVDSNKSILEIITQCSHNNIKLNMNIVLCGGSELEVNIN
jgi:hypothetical protein